MLNNFRENIPLFNYQFCTVDLAYEPTHYHRALVAFTHLEESYNRKSESFKNTFQCGQFDNITQLKNDVTNHNFELQSVLSYMGDKDLNKLVIVENNLPYDQYMSWSIIGLDKSYCPLETDPVTRKERQFNTDDLKLALTVLQTVEQSRLLVKGWNDQHLIHGMPGYEDDKYFAKTLSRLQYPDITKKIISNSNLNF